MTTSTITTEALIAAFAGETSGKVFEATFIPNDAPYPSVSLWDHRFFKATNKAEAVKIAREYGKRIADKKMIYVYVAGKSGI